jgi:hypothetical protein
MCYYSSQIFYKLKSGIWEFYVLWLSVWERKSRALWYKTLKEKDKLWILVFGML